MVKPRRRFDRHWSSQRDGSLAPLPAPARCAVLPGRIPWSASACRAPARPRSGSAGRDRRAAAAQAAASIWVDRHSPSAKWRAHQAYCDCWCRRARSRGSDVAASAPGKGRRRCRAAAAAARPSSTLRDRRVTGVRRTRSRISCGGRGGPRSSSRGVRRHDCGLPSVRTTRTVCWCLPPSLSSAAANSRSTIMWLP